MRARIAKYRRSDPDDRSDFPIGCRILTQPFFLDEADWIPVPANWSPNIVSFKTYNTGATEGLALWEAVNDRLSQRPFLGIAEKQARFGEPHLIRPAVLGQGAFRVLVTDIYGRSCAVTRERTLPRRWGRLTSGPMVTAVPTRCGTDCCCGRDIHSLFDAGYVTVTADLDFEVSLRIKAEFENGQHYYALHGQRINAPQDASQRPDPDVRIPLIVITSSGIMISDSGHRDHPP